MVGLLGAFVAFAGPALAQPSPAPPTVIDGPSAAIASLGGLSIARDGTGGLIYSKAVAGVPHVFVEGNGLGQPARVLVRGGKVVKRGERVGV